MGQNPKQKMTRWVGGGVGAVRWEILSLRIEEPGTHTMDSLLMIKVDWLIGAAEVSGGFFPNKPTFSW
jgi:hypothetical protein